MNAQRPGVSSRAGRLWRPAAAGPIRYWQEQLRLAVKGAVAAAAAWTIARYAVGEPDPYFAPLAALLGVYPTVARSLRESLQYAAGFLLGAALAIPVGVLLGPSIPAIALIVFIGVLISAWPLLGDQSPQVTFTALFALLLAGHQPLHYVLPRLVDVAIGVTTGLVVNTLPVPARCSFARPNMPWASWRTIWPAPWTAWRRLRMTRTACRPGHSTTDRSPAAQSRPVRQCAGPAKACAGTCGPSPTSGPRPTAPSSTRSKSSPPISGPSAVTCSTAKPATAGPVFRSRSAGRTRSCCGPSRPSSARSATCNQPGPAAMTWPPRRACSIASSTQLARQTALLRTRTEPAGRTDEPAGSGDGGLVRLTARILQDIAEYTEHRSSAGQGVRK